MKVSQFIHIVGIIDKDRDTAYEAGILLKYRLLLCTTPCEKLIEDALLFFAECGGDETHALDQFCFASFIAEVLESGRYLEYELEDL